MYFCLLRNIYSWQGNLRKKCLPQRINLFSSGPAVSPTSFSIIRWLLFLLSCLDSSSIWPPSVRLLPFLSIPGSSSLDQCPSQSILFWCSLPLPCIKGLLWTLELFLQNLPVLLYTQCHWFATKMILFGTVLASTTTLLVDQLAVLSGSFYCLYPLIGVITWSLYSAFVHLLTDLQ